MLERDRHVAGKGVDLGDVVAQIGHIAEGRSASIARDVVELIDDAVDGGKPHVRRLLLMGHFLRTYALHHR